MRRLVGTIPANPATCRDTEQLGSGDGCSERDTGARWHDTASQEGDRRRFWEVADQHSKGGRVVALTRHQEHPSPVPDRKRLSGSQLEEPVA